MKPIHVINSVTGSRGRYEIEYESCYTSPQKPSVAPHSPQINGHCPSGALKVLYSSPILLLCLYFLSYFFHESYTSAFSSNRIFIFSCHSYVLFAPSSGHVLLSTPNYQNPAHPGRLSEVKYSCLIKMLPVALIRHHSTFLCSVP